MYEEGERQRSVLFRICKDGDLYSIPIQCITWVEPLVGRQTAVKIQGNAENEQYMLFFDILGSGKLLTLEKSTIPIVANGECLVNVSIEAKHPMFYFARYNPQTVMNKPTITNVTLPSRAKLFKESVCYASTQGLWSVFVGTGLLFGESVVDGSWGYLDTQQTTGAITRFQRLLAECRAGNIDLSSPSRSPGLPGTRWCCSRPSGS